MVRGQEGLLVRMLAPVEWPQAKEPTVSMNFLV